MIPATLQSYQSLVVGPVFRRRDWCRLRKTAGRILTWLAWSRNDLDRSHHALVFVLQKMAMIDKRSHGIRITKIHPHANAGVGESSPIVIRHIYGVAEKIFLDGLSLVIEKQKVQLMDVEGVQL